ncbi:MAG TPA: hypothetical protein PK156_32975 [Polyangium sp.]|nr:hypothetical protein [Polyangium sp.]
MRTQIHRSNWVKPLLWLFGGSSARSYVEIDGDTLHIRFGFLFDERIPLSNIVEVERQHWPMLAGIGWRTNLIDSIAVVGSYSNVVRLKISPRMWMKVIFPVRAESLYVSVDDPDTFVSEIRARITKRG